MRSTNEARRGGRIALCAIATVGIATAVAAANTKKDFTEDFDTAACTFETTGNNSHFPLQVGHQLRLEGEDPHEGLVEVEITVTAATELVDGVLTRVVQEREWIDGDLVEVSWNFFASCAETGDVYYFGEDVDIFEDDGTIVHDGAWRAGVDGALPGLIMPGTFLLGSRYHQEIAPGVAEDRAEHVGIGLLVSTPFGPFEGCVEVDETTPLEPGQHGRKLYAPGVGLVFDDGVELVGFTPAP
jgi:hypothetical protein